ncbi:MAG TPA: hypothetical protein DCZ01_10840 [Elusimicrobia bacterium]|nr:MAG: hypothetical protein A2X37_04730 [Elusimicrobia bacterium GWA2_66_18]OGR71945.1 MAG: hypothetical protein A2X40_01700 [Elusimicrobia bacterium GWC2_65_9]HAZ08988.1 hypothetical protein [Elusimicrobiota bacterium]
MIRAILLAVCLPAAAATTPSPVPSSAGVINLSLVDALTAIEEPRLSGIFSFIAEQDSTFAFADLLARDKKALKRYLVKLQADLKAANGLTGWDHEVCATLVNLYSSPFSSTLEKPDPKKMSQINNCVLAGTVALADIVARRGK